MTLTPTAEIDTRLAEYGADVTGIGAVTEPPSNVVPIGRRPRPQSLEDFREECARLSFDVGVRDARIVHLTRDLKAANQDRQHVHDTATTKVESLERRIVAFQIAGIGLSLAFGASLWALGLRWWLGR